MGFQTQLIKISNLAHAATDLHMGVHNIRSYLRLQIGLMLIGLSIVLRFPVCIFCLEGRVCSHDQCEEKKQIPHWQCRGSVWWELHVTVRDLITNISECIMCCLFSHRLAFLCLVSVTLFNCSVGRQDCSRCRTADPKYGCVWCGSSTGSRCVYHGSCDDEIQHTCPAPVIHFVRIFWPGFEH